MRIIKNRFIPPKRFAAINLFGVVFTRQDRLSALTRNHEGIHSAQIRELLYIFFYISYLIEYLVRLAQCRNIHTAYRYISFEREAYENQADMYYLKNRKRYMFINFYKIKNENK